jgi:hypothetical protein
MSEVDLGLKIRQFLIDESLFMMSEVDLGSRSISS